MALLENWQDWPGHVAALVGPEASGKSHLAKGWAKENGAFLYGHDLDISALPQRALVVCDDADRNNIGENALFHLFNWTKEIGGKLLLTAREHPTLWQVQLPDLRSRLATVTVGEINEPDDELLMVLLIKLFSDRQLQVDMGVIHYVLPRIERSFYSVHRFVERLDEMSLTNQRKITKALAKKCL